jgi:CPA1 family monovalent cation:H+ antiporter
METETTFILLFALATGVALLARRLRIPYTVALVLAGLILGGLDLIPAPELTKNLLFAVFLPGLIFEAAFHIDSREFRANLITILSLAVPGVIASTALVAFALTPLFALLGLATGFDWKVGLVFGALISATDPVAVVALFRTMCAPRRLTLLLDGESLLNDGTAIVFFTLSLSLLAGTATTASQLMLQFFSIVGVGALIGTTIGVAVALLTRKIDDPMIEITLTTIAAYGSFVSAETLHASGVIATVAAGMLCGNFGVRGGGMSASTRVATETFWEYVVFALNSIVFLLVGFEVQISNLLADWLPILVAYLVVTAGRAIMIVAGQGLLGFTRERFPRRWTAVLTWGGLRGALPMVLVLSLPVTFPNRDLLVSMTFGVALLSILVQGLTMSGLLRWLGLVTGAAESTEYELRNGRLQAAAAALRELDRLAADHTANPGAIEILRTQYQRRADEAEQELRKLTLSSQDLQRGALRRTQRRLLDTERDQVIQSFHQGALSRESQQKLLADIDARAAKADLTDISPRPPDDGNTDFVAPVVAAKEVER